MPVKDLGKDLKGSLNNTIETLKTKSREIEMPDIKQAKYKAAKKMKNIFKKINNAKADVSMQDITYISIHSAIEIIYLLMSADGKIHQNEEEKFNLIGKELDENFADSKQQIIDKCQAILDKAACSENYYNTLKNAVESVLCSEQKIKGSFITPKHLVWNLLSIAYSDEEYSDIERKLLRYIAQRLNIENAILLEMESTILTVMDIEQELLWIKTTNRPYLTIESVVNELTERKNVIYEGILSLIAL